MIVEAGAIGLAASLVGLALGVALANGLTALFDSVGLTMPQGDMVFATRTVVVSLLVGHARSPCWRASCPPSGRRACRRSRPSARAPRCRPGRLSRLGPAVALAAIAGGGRAPRPRRLGRDGGLLAFGAGAVLLFVGVAMTSSRLVRPIAALVGWPIARWAALGQPGPPERGPQPGADGLDRRGADGRPRARDLRQRARRGLLDSTEKGVERQLGAGYVVTSTNGSDPLPAAVGRALAASPDAGTVSSVREDAGLVEGSRSTSRVDPATIASVYRFDWTEGSDAALATLDGDGVVVERSFAEDHDLAIGSPLAIVSPRATSCSAP